MGRDQLNGRIPVKNDMSKGFKDSEEAKALTAELENYDRLTVKFADLIAKVYQSLNEENVNPQILSVLSKKTNEEVVFNENKSRYDLMINEILSVQKEIFNSKTNMKLKNEIYKKSKIISAKPNEENEKVFLKLR